MHMYRLPTALFIWALCHIGSVNGYVRPRDDTPTGVNSASSAIVTPAFTFNHIPEMTTCQPAVITWMYSPVTVDDPLELTLVITNQNVAQPSPPSATTTGTFATPNVGRAWNRRDVLPVTQQITNSSIDPLLRTFTWPSVNVSAGWYELEASLNLPGFLQESLSFYVANGTDVSCFAPPTPSSSASSDPSSTGSPTSTGAAETSGVTLPVSSGSSKVNRGAIAGGVIGGLAVVAAAIAAYFYLRYASASSASKGSPGNRAQRKWAGLSSTDSKARVYPPASRSAGVSSSGRHHSQSDSIGPMLSSRDSNVYVIGNVGIDSRPSRINDAPEEEDEVNSYFSPSQEKISSTSPGRSPFSDSSHGHADAVPLDYIPSAAAVTRNSSTSTSSYMNNFSRPRSHPSSPYASPTTAEGPFSDSAQQNTSSSSIVGQESSSYPPTPSPAFPSGTSQAISERRGSGGDSVTSAAPPTRRTPRKPVPQYNPTDPALVSSSPPVPSPLPPVQDSDSSSSREGSVRRAFGDGRPVHYLIPDMPPPQRD